MSQVKIALFVEVSQSSISREIKRNLGARGYRANQADAKAKAKAKERKKNTIRAYVMIPSTVAEITKKIKENWSPEQISGWFKKRPEIPISVSHETIYKFIWADKKKAGNLYSLLRRKAKKYNARCKDKQAGRGFIKDRVGIEDRPPIINERGRVGDREIDLVIGKGHSGALVTIVERVTRYTVTLRVFDKSARTVTDATIALLRPFKDSVLSITPTMVRSLLIIKKFLKPLIVITFLQILTALGNED